MKNQKYYDVGVVAFMIDSPKIRNSPEFEAEQDRLIELTMSCNRDEAIGWMRQFMGLELANMPGSYNFHWRVRFLAAYDLYESLSNHKS